MGFKRPYDEELQELPLKNPRQFGYNDKLTRFADTIPHIEVQGRFRKDLWHGEFKTGALDDTTHLADEDFETSAPLSLVTSTSSEEDTGSGVAAISPVSSEYVDFDFPRKTFSSIDDDYYLPLDRSPRKQVLLGPNHQANVPSWGRHMKNNKFVQNDASETVDNDNEDIILGTCIIPMPNSDLSENNSGKVGAGRTDCSCLDRGSIRCVQQHVIEARKLLKKSLGHEKFVELGFYNMGEAVAYKWSEEDEKIFREVVYTNRVSLGWKHLSAIFSSRSKGELVSYYYNVFILQRRAIQNRSSILDIDSDDDELYKNQQSYKVKALEEDEDSAIESLSDQEDLENHDDDENDSDDDSGNTDGDNLVGDYSSGLSKEDYGINLLLKEHVLKSFDESGSDPVFQQTDMGSGIVEDFDIQQEFQPNMVDSHSLIATKANLHDNGMKTKISQTLLPQSKLDESKELVSNMYLLDTFDTKIWDTEYATSSTKGIDLQPTSNIIEEIFGQDT